MLVDLPSATLCCVGVEPLVGRRVPGKQRTNLLFIGVTAGGGDGAVAVITAVGSEAVGATCVTLGYGCCRLPPPPVESRVCWHWKA